MDYTITPECIALAQNIKKIIGNDSMPPHVKNEAFCKSVGYNDANRDNDFRSSIWLQLLILLMDDYIDALSHDFSFVDGYSIDDLQKLLNSIIDDIINHRVPTLGANSGYYYKAIYNYVDKDFCKAKSDINYLVDCIIDILKKNSIDYRVIKKNNKTNYIVFNACRGKAIRVSRKSIRVIYKTIIDVPLYEPIALKWIANEAVLKFWLEKVVKERIPREK